MNPRFMTFLVAVCVTSTISAQETRQHDSHAHGIGELNMVVEGNELVIEFISPAANIIGFEHSAGGTEEIETLKQAEQALNQAENLFILPTEAACILEHSDIESSLLNEHTEDEHGEAHDEHAENEDHEDHEEDEEHAENEAHEDHEEDEEHAENEAHEEHEEDDAGTHSEFHAQYEFQCAEIEKLTEINVNVFNVFPLTDSLNVQLLSISGQSQKTLNKDNSLLVF